MKLPAYIAWRVLRALVIILTFWLWIPVLLVFLLISLFADAAYEVYSGWKADYNQAYGKDSSVWKGLDK